MKTLFDKSRRHGKTYASDMRTVEELKSGKSVVFVGITTDEDAAKVYWRLLDTHNVKTTYKPTLKTPRPKPVFDMNHPESTIIDYQYFEPIVTGYEFTLFNTKP